ncbi:unnamed protein product [Lactuca saligna]|uniref:F-box domain-containing protein n=1 Tax=Lactuca saligna TaxID=75948 RepID=A0AA35ZHF4_LACSI|nr:unnamed protein product [Lactuca saligna]
MINSYPDCSVLIVVELPGHVIINMVLEQPLYQSHFTPSKKLGFISQSKKEQNVNGEQSRVRAFATPKKKQFLGSESLFCYERSLLEALPQEILIKILCGVDHDDLKRLFHVSKPIREAALIAKKLHFEYSTPKKIPAFRCSLNLEEFPSRDFDEIEAPNAPKQSRVSRSRLTKKNLAAITVSLFASYPSDE